MNKYLAILFVVLMSGIPRLYAGKVVFIFPLEQEINAAAWQHTRRACQEARKADADMMLVCINTYGGALDAADSIRTALLDMPMPVVAYIDHNAASAGALIALSCDTIYMSPGSSIGAATVVDGNGAPLPDKYQSYMRSIMRSTAERTGRSPEMAARMVGPDSVLTFTAGEAVSAGVARGLASSVQQVLKQTGYSHAEQRYYQPAVSDTILGFLSNAVVQGVLIMLIIGGIYMEMHTPGMGFAAAVSLVCAVLYFLPMIIPGVLPAWVLIAFIAGVVLMALEIFVVPGFGVTGIAGIVCILASLTGALLSADAITGIDTAGLSRAVLTVGAGLVLAVLLIWWLTSSHGPAWARRNSSLETILSNDDGFIAVDTAPALLVGRTATAATDLRPSGKIIIDNKTYDAVSQDGFISIGTLVTVTSYSSAQLYVKAFIDKSQTHL